MQISSVNNNRNDNITKTSEKRYAEDAAIALAGMGSLFSDVLNNLQDTNNKSSQSTVKSETKNVSTYDREDRNISEKQVDNKSKEADNSPKKSDDTTEESQETKSTEKTENKSDTKKTDRSDINKTDKSDSNQTKSTTTVNIKSDASVTDKQASDQVKMQDQMDFIKKFENANIKISVKSDSNTPNTINDIQNMLANSSAANIDTMSDNVLKSAGIKDLFDGKSFEQIKDIFNNSGTNFSDMSGFNFDMSGQKILDKANSLKFDKVIKTQIKEFASKLTSLVKNVPNSTNATAKMILRPESLGTVFVDINSTEGVVKLKIKAQSQTVVDKLEAQIAELRQKLEKSGLVADQIEFALYEEGNETFNSFGYSKDKQDEMEARKDFVRSFTGQTAEENTQEELRISRTNGIEQYI